MLLKLNGSGELRLVYELLEELKHDHEQVAMAQALTKDDSKSFGLKGTHGLFGSEEWWENIKNGVMPTRHISGVIDRLFVSGQEQDSEENAFDLLLDDGSIHTESIFVNNKSDIDLFKKGSRVEVLYALDELKSDSPGGANYSEIVLEMAVSK